MNMNYFSKQSEDGLNSHLSISKAKLLESYNSDITYKLIVRTGNVENAGTCANVFVQLCGSGGTLSKQALKNEDKCNFLKGSVSTFEIYGPSVGELQSILVETDAFEEVDSWYLQDILIIHVHFNKAWYFPCNAWFSLWKGDGKVSRILEAKNANSADMMFYNTEYEVTVVTGNLQKAGTTANVFITLFSNDICTPRIHLACKEKDCFSRGKKDSFLIKSPYMGTLTKIRIEHDNSGSLPDWFLEKVIIRDLRNPNRKYYFPCETWLSGPVGESSVSCDLPVSMDPKVKGTTLYRIEVYTGHEPRAGTDAHVFITLFGEMGMSDEFLLNNDPLNFTTGRIDEIVVESIYLGPLRRVRVRHDNTGFDPSWFLDKLVVEDMNAKKVYEFPCHRWLADNKLDGRIERELIAISTNLKPSTVDYQYTIKITTGDLINSSTSASVYLEMHGGKSRQESSGRLWLKGGRFQRGHTDIFDVEVAALLSPLSYITIGHDNSGITPGWFLNKVVVFCLETGIEQTFVCNKWLTRSIGDGLISRDLFESEELRKQREKMVPWLISIYTGDRFGAGTDADVCFVLYGNKGNSSTIRLQNKSNSFERGKIDSFRVAIIDVGIPFKLRIWQTEKGHFTGWFLDKVHLENILTMEEFYFPCNRWFSRNKTDSQVMREIPAHGSTILMPLNVVEYSVQIFTGINYNAGTDANVYICIYGEYGDTGDRHLTKTNLTRFIFERGKMEEFIIEAVNLGYIDRIKMKHDSYDTRKGWFLEKVVIKQMSSNKPDITFYCNRWFSLCEDDGVNERILFPCYHQDFLLHYKVIVHVGQCKYVGEMIDLYLMIIGEKEVTEEMNLQIVHKKEPIYQERFVKGFNLQAVDVGKVVMLKLFPGNCPIPSCLFISKIEVEIPGRGEQYIFECNQWLPPKGSMTDVELVLSNRNVAFNEKSMVSFALTSELAMPLMLRDSGLYIQLFGFYGKSKRIHLKMREKQFRPSHIHNFNKIVIKDKIDTIDVGNLIKIRIGWQSKASNSPLIYLEYVKLERLKFNCENLVENTYWFVWCHWLSKEKYRPGVTRDLVPTTSDGRILPSSLKMKSYKIAVYSGNQSGTTANVSMNIFGMNGDSGDILIENSHLSRFKKGESIEFKMSFVDLGCLTKLRVWHDNSGPAPDWFLDRIEIEDVEDRQRYCFPCGEWLAVSVSGFNSCQLSKDLLPVPNISSPVPALRLVTYQVRVLVGDKRGKEADANLYITLFGTKGDSGRHRFSKTVSFSELFGKNETFIFTIETVDVGNLEKIRLEYNDNGPGSAWYLLRTEVKNSLNYQTVIFPGEMWISNKCTNSPAVRELFPLKTRQEF